MKRLVLSILLALTLVPASADAARSRSVEQAKALMRSHAPGYVVHTCKRSGRAIRCDLYRDARGWRYLRRGTWAADGRLAVGRKQRVCRVSTRKSRCALKLKRA